MENMRLYQNLHQKHHHILSSAACPFVHLRFSGWWRPGKTCGFPTSSGCFSVRFPASLQTQPSCKCDFTSSKLNVSFELCSMRTKSEQHWNPLRVSDGDGVWKTWGTWKCRSSENISQEVKQKAAVLNAPPPQQPAGYTGHPTSPIKWNLLNEARTL